MRIGLLGAVTVWPVSGARYGGQTGENGQVGVAALRGLRLRGLLARLALDPDRPVTTETLIDALWGEAPPDAAGNALQALVSRLRRALGADLVTTVPGGYRLPLAPHEVDASRFAALRAEAAVQTDPAVGHALLSTALELWRGPALADIRDLPFAGPASDALAEQRAAAVDERAWLGLRLGRPTAELEALRAQLTAVPLRESTAALLARGLHAAGRRADALAVLDRTRSLLAEELGVDPGKELTAAQLAVLRGQLLEGQPPPGPVTVLATRPARLTSFVGRGDDLRRVRELLTAVRLVTLTGPGGAGKTRLAHEVLASSAARTVELAALTGADQLPATLLAAVGGPELRLRIPEEAPTATTERLLSALAGRDLVLLLDNCEHLIDAVAALARQLLEASPRLRVITTSREPLGVPGEVLHPVEPLAGDDAVRLFLDRAAAVRPGFAPAPDEHAAVTEICRRLDRQPLPIELAAARLRTLSPAEIAARLDDRFRLLTSGSRTALPRHQTLRAVVDWSWDLLSEPERALARRLGVFAGGATLAAAERVCTAPGAPTAGEVLDLLAALVDKSLVVAVPGSSGAPTRYRMLETIRHYATERLDEADERAAAQTAHTEFVLELAETAEPHLRTRDQLSWLSRLRAESDEITAVLRRSVTAGDTATAHRLVAAMVWSWLLCGLYDEPAAWVAAVCALPGVAPAEARARNLASLAMSQVINGDVTAAGRTLEQAVAVAAELPAPQHPMLVLMEPVAAMFTGGGDGPIRRVAQTSADPWVRAFALQMGAQYAENNGDIDTQRRLVRAAHEAFAPIGDRFGLGMVVHSLGELEELAGNRDAARRAYDEAITLATELANDDDLPQFLARRAQLDAYDGDLDSARTLLRRAAGAAAGPMGSVGTVRAVLAEVELRAGNVAEARVQLGLAAADLAGGGMAIPQRRALLAATRAEIERVVGDEDAARAALAEAVEAALESRDGPVTAAMAELAARFALEDGDTAGAALLLGVASAQRGTLNRGHPEVLATLDAVHDALGPAEARKALERGRELPKPDGLARLQDYARRR